MRRRGAVHALVLALLLLVLGTHVSAAPQPDRVAFTAVGDFAATSNTSGVLNAINSTDSDLTLALGDLSYGTTGQEQAWCDFVTSRVGAGYPFELLAGNHEAAGQNGNINDFSACLPNQLPGAVGTYGRQYYVDVPADEPLVRFVMISPNLTFPDGTWNYPAGSARYTWTAAAIDGARAASIPWVVVGMHKPCLSVGVYACDPGADVFNLLLSKKVDLILSGHEHGYMRSHQLGLRAGCAAVVPGAFDADCLTDTDDAYAQGGGSVAAVVGTGGVNLRDVNSADAEAGYFDAFSGLNANPTWGALNVVATPASLQASFLRGAGGTFSDSFTLTRSTTPNTSPAASFTSSCTDLSCSFNGTGSSDPDGTIASYAWSFGDGGTGTGATPTHAYASAGTYTVGLTVTDNAGASASTTRSVTVTRPPGPTTYASDQFSRTVSNGWGTAPTGGAWTVTSTASSYSVNGSTGNLVSSAGSGRLAYLGTVSAPSVDALVTVGVDKLPTGSGIYLSTYARRITGQGYYLGKARVTSTGAVSLELARADAAGAETVISTATTISGLTYAVGEKLNVRVQAVGASPTTVRAKVWKAGTAEPVAWQRSITDSTAGLQAPGHVGFGTYLSSGATNSPVITSVDQLTATAP